MPQLDEKGAAKLQTVEGHIARLERELKDAQETRRELINYYGLNKEREHAILTRIAEAQFNRWLRDRK